jgi:hypothetical protein
MLVAGEYFVMEFTTYLKMKGIRSEFSFHYTVEQNGVVETRTVRL